MTALENVNLPNQISGALIDDKKGIELLKSVGLKNRLNHYPHQLSGGEQQRVAIARSLITSPEILIADEPTGNLDKKNSEEVMKLIFKLQSDFASTLILVTHDETIAEQCNKTIKLDNGLIIKDE
jgi:putative ABC transport system ATP-binding protein